MKYLISLFRKALGSPLVYLSNSVGIGTHGDGCVTKKADAEQTLRHALVKIGSDIDHVAVTTAATEVPLGFCDDEADAAEDNINVQLLGQKQGTVKGIAHAEITAGDWLVPAAAGRVQTLTGLTTGTYYIVGRALNAATAQDDEVEIQHCVPMQREVA